MSRPTIAVLAGTNGAGKSSVGGARLHDVGTTWFNPDRATREILSANPSLGPEQANSLAWRQGARLLDRAISERRDFAIETTLGGNSITAKLLLALARGLRVRVWYVGLTSPELHVERVGSRVAKGGHDIPETAIRHRFDASRLNLVRLIEAGADVQIYDNSAAADPARGRLPTPVLLVELRGTAITHLAPPEAIASWARPLVAAVLKRAQR